MNSRNMKIFEMVLEQGQLELAQLQQCWEAANRDLRFAQHKDLAKVIIAKRLMPREELDKITNAIDKVGEVLEKPAVEATDVFFKRMKEISRRIEKTRFIEATKKEEEPEDDNPHLDMLLTFEPTIELPHTDQQIENTDLREIKSKVQKAVTPFADDEKNLDLIPESDKKSSKLPYFIIIVLIIIVIVLVVILAMKP